MKIFIKNVGEHQKLFRDDATGIAWVEDGTSGCCHSVHPSIDRTGSIRGMKNLGYWGKDDKVKLAGGYYYNISRLVYDKQDPCDTIVANECMCESCIKRRGK